MAKLSHSSTRRGFSTHNSIGTDSLINENWTGGNQPGMIELKDINGGAWYVWVETDGTLKITSTVDTIPSAETDGEEVGAQT
jgi:hypothetical protein